MFAWWVFFFNPHRSAKNEFSKGFGAIELLYILTGSTEEKIPPKLIQIKAILFISYVVCVKKKCCEQLEKLLACEWMHRQKRK